VEIRRLPRIKGEDVVPLIVKSSTRHGIAALGMLIGVVAMIVLGLTAGNGWVFPVGPSTCFSYDSHLPERGPVSKGYPHGNQIGYGGANQLPPCRGHET